MEMTYEQAVERMKDLIHTCEVGIAEHGEYDDLFQKDKEAIEIVLGNLEALTDMLRSSEIQAKELERKIKIKNKYLQLIADIGYDYDGFDTRDSLKDLIDQLVDLAVQGIKNDDTACIYIGANDKQYNILQEKIDKIIKK